MSLYFQVTTNNAISNKLKSIKKELEKLPDEAYKVFVANTAVRSGNARRNTRKKGKEIQANYPYAKRLDEGYSKQYPEGMTKPTEEFIKKRYREIVKGK